MIDLHNHILWGIDDGAKSKEMTLAMLATAQKEGIDTIAATPHFIQGANAYCKEKYVQAFLEIENLIKKNHINIQIVKGNELFLDEYAVAAVEKGECQTINGSRYVLVEFPMIEYTEHISNMLYELLEKKYIPIIAHPERYGVFKRNPNELLEWIYKGCLVQVNSSSITGLFGREVQYLSEILLKHRMVHMIASDAHSNGKRAPKLLEAYELVSQWVNKEYADLLVRKIPERILQDETIDDIPEPKVYIQKSSVFSRVFKLLNLS